MIPLLRPLIAGLLLVSGLHAQAPARSVLLMVMDDVGRAERPLLTSLDALASCGIELEQAYAYPVCSVTRYALAFGEHPRRGGVGDVLNAFSGTERRLPLALTSIAEVMDRSHATALVGKQHLGRAPWPGDLDLAFTEAYAQGWESFLAGNCTGLGAGLGGGGYYSWNRVENGTLQVETVYATDVQRDAFLAWWGATPGPKLAQLSWSAAHSPYDRPPGYPVAVTNRQKYEQVVSYLNAAMAAVLAQVDLTTTYVIVVGDNGTPDDARPVGTPTGYWKGSTYQGGIRVPLVIAGPGVGYGVSQRLVSVLDIPATIAELTGVAVPAGALQDSVSFADELGPWGGAAPRQFLHVERYRAVQDEQAIVETVTQYGTISLQLKLRRDDVDGTGALPAVDRVYDLLSDPYELAPGDPSTLPPALRNRLYAELASLPPRAP